MVKAADTSWISTVSATELVVSAMKRLQQSRASPNVTVRAPSSIMKSDVPRRHGEVPSPRCSSRVARRRRRTYSTKSRPVQLVRGADKFPQRSLCATSPRDLPSFSARVTNMASIAPLLRVRCPVPFKDHRLAVDEGPGDVWPRRYSKAFFPVETHLSPRSYYRFCQPCYWRSCSWR